MKIVNKKEFPLVDELINSLFEKFKKQGWQFPENLPEIHLDDVTVIVLPTNEKNGLRGFNPDYRSATLEIHNYALLSDYKNEDKSPKIIIFKKVLDLTAKMLEEYDRYFFVPLPSGGYDKVDKRNLLHFKQEGIENDYGISFEDAKINLFYCAVLNEISKWILVDTPINNTWKDNPLNKKNNLHECLTTLLSSWICKEGSIELNKSFDYLMLLNNIEQYKTYSDYANLEIPTVIQCINICRIKTNGYLYFELLDLLLEISKSHKTLDSNNFTGIILEKESQDKVVTVFRDLTYNSDHNLIDTMYNNFLNIENRNKYSGFYSGIRYGI